MNNIVQEMRRLYKKRLEHLRSELEEIDKKLLGYEFELEEEDLLFHKIKIQQLELIELINFEINSKKFYEIEFIKFKMKSNNDY